MATKKRGLGKGLDSLIPDGKIAVGKGRPGGAALIDEKDAVIEININQVEPDRDQPRKTFNEDELNDLADSIRAHGIFQPLLVQKKDDYYEIVAGERRWRAAKIAELKEVPCIVREFTEQEKVTIQLIENIQREDLNPIDEALAYRRLIDEFHMKQDEVAESVGKNRTTITNSMRLLNLADEIQEMLVDERLTPGHARALLSISNKEEQIKVANQVFDEQMTVRETEKFVKSLGKPKRPKKLTPEALQLIYRQLEDRMREKIGAKVSIKASDEKKGRIEIEYFSQDELEEIVDKIVKGAS
ncbi:MAG: ParB/RepB/Spo0J family partition protein [Lachnospiraceae bacterium]|nr:ParB/RepB/Spo0J family partition protein [Lachnospiraceae bacterium]